MLSMDFNQKVVIETGLRDWVASPISGVWRKPLAREDAERGHATSIVRYETGNYPAGTYFRNPEGFRHSPFSAEGCEQVALVRWPAGEHFQAHSHFGGEEIYVISGELRDEHGSYPQGTWIRSPHMSTHFPFVDEDTLIWVKVGHLPA